VAGEEKNSDGETMQTQLSSAPSGVTNPVVKSAPGDIKVVRFEEIAGDQKEVLIDNHGDIYRLRRTRLGKLILTK